MFAQLIGYATILAPAWYWMGRHYFTSPFIHRDIKYGPSHRNDLDIYVPNRKGRELVRDERHKYPVVVFFTGGAWVIGYKAWMAFAGFALCRMGVLCVTPDYRNHPQGCIDDMLVDVNTAMEWVVAHVEEWGGDINRIYLVGQSAGAHLSALAMLVNAKQYAHTTYSKDDCDTVMRPHACTTSSDAVEENGSHLPVTSQHATFRPTLTHVALTAAHQLRRLSSLAKLALPGSATPPASIVPIHSPSQRRLSLYPGGSQTQSKVNGKEPSDAEVERNKSFSHSDHTCHLGPISAPHVVGASLCWSTLLKGYVGVSGVYDLPAMITHLTKRGLPSSMLYSVMKAGSSDELQRCSPLHIARQPWLVHQRHALTLLPPVLLCHGTTDQTVGWNASAEFADVLAQAGLNVEVRYHGGTHTDPIIEDFLLGDDVLVHDILNMIQRCENPSGEQAKKVLEAREKGQKVVDVSKLHRSPISRVPLIPSALTLMARKCNPF
jgi:acetyl esterase/lipase